MSAPLVPALPDGFIESDDETVQLFQPVVLKAWKKLVELGGTYNRIRDAKVAAENALDNSEDPRAVSYREAASLADDAIESIDNEMNEELKAVRAKFSERRKAVTSKLKAHQSETLDALQLAQVEDIDPDQLAASYLANYKALKNAANAVKDDFPQLAEYVKAQVPSRFSQTPGNSGGSGDQRGWTPRLVFATVNDVPVDPTTFGAIAKFIGIKASEGGRKLLVGKLLESIVTQDNLSTDVENPSKFTVKYNDTLYNIAVAAKGSDAADE